MRTVNEIRQMEEKLSELDTDDTTIDIIRDVLDWVLDANIEDDRIEQHIPED